MLVYVYGKQYRGFVRILHSIGGTLVVSKNHCARCHFAVQEIKKKQIHDIHSGCLFPGALFFFF